VISVKCLDNDFTSSLEKLRELFEAKISSEDYYGDRPAGFGE